jgi:hypothetical protein
VHAFKGASDSDKKRVIQHRYQLQNYLLQFLERVQGYFAVRQLEVGQTTWMQFITDAMGTIEKVEVEENIEGEVEAEPNPLAN